MIREEILYGDALDLIEKALKGETVNPQALSTAMFLLQRPFEDIYFKHENESKVKKDWEDEIS